jgi:8-oxo-dGTP diphosphatase
MSKTENVELTVLCLIYRGNKILLQDRFKNDWKGYTLPGGHVEKDESFINAVKREMREETGLTIKNPILCGIKQFPIDNGRYLVFLYKTNDFEGDLTSSEEGEMVWVDRDDLCKYNLVNDFFDLISVFDDDNLSEFQYVINEGQWEVVLT